uniref:Uncharacterized protein n=1 Tax=Timema poppense TaxID=170557 RepID=A0A7R9CUR9_TIMPO|nr:unnamed protein product [Timema poppensis]
MSDNVSSSSDEDIVVAAVLLESEKKEWIHEINKKRKVFGETLFEDLIHDDNKNVRWILLLLFFLYFNAHAHIYSAVIGSPYKRVRRKLKLGNFYGVRTLWPEQSDIVASISYGPRTYGYGVCIHQHMSVEDLRSVFQVDHHEKGESLDSVE